MKGPAKRERRVWVRTAIEQNGHRFDMTTLRGKIKRPAKGF